MNINDKPLFKLFVVGYPGDNVQYYPNAAKEFGINLEVVYHGCIVRLIYSNGHGIQITDSGVERVRIEEENKFAEEYYTIELSKDWLDQVAVRAQEICEEHPKFIIETPIKISGRKKK